MHHNLDLLRRRQRKRRLERRRQLLGRFVIRAAAVRPHLSSVDRRVRFQVGAEERTEVDEAVDSTLLSF